MNPKARDASISDRLNHITKTDGFDKAKALVAECRLGKSQPEADRWLLIEQIKRCAWPVVAGIAIIIGAITDFKALL